MPEGSSTQELLSVFGRFGPVRRVEAQAARHAAIVEFDKAVGLQASNVIPCTRINKNLYEDMIPSITLLAPPSTPPSPLLRSLTTLLQAALAAGSNAGGGGGGTGLQLRGFVLL